MSKVAKVAKVATPAPVATVAPVAPVAPLVLVGVPPTTCRAGTARAAAYAALTANIGQPRATVLAAVKAAETQWHKDNGRTPKGINPGGWLALFKANFAAPPQA